MLSLGVQSSSSSGAPRKQSSASLTLDQMLLNSSCHATDVPLDVAHRGCQDLDSSRRSVSRLRGHNKHEIVKKEVEQSNDPVPCKNVKKQIDSPQFSDAYAKHLFYGNNSTLQAAKNDHKQEVTRGLVETTVQSKARSNASYS